MMSRWMGVLCVFALCLAGCAEDEGGSGSTVVLASEFDQSCFVDEDCAVVYDGDTCGCTVCPTAAVAVSALDAFTAEKAAKRCAEPLSCPAIACGDTFVGTCEANVCGIRKAVVIDAGDYDNTCTTSDDCMGIREGEVCEVCGCPSAAVNISAADDIRAKRESVTCHNPDVLCEPCPESVPTCNAGVCTY